MRSYLAMELIATIWLVGAILAKSEKLDRVWILCCVFAFFYGLRAVINYFTMKEKENLYVKKNASSGTYAGDVRMRDYSHYPRRDC